MYNQGHQQAQNVFMNGGHGQRYAVQMNAAKPFQSNQHHQQHAQHRQQQDHAGHGHNTNFANHQHNLSTSGFAGGNQHFNNPSRNDSPGHHLQNGLSRPSEHWEQQLALYRDVQEAQGTHHHARNHPNNKATTGVATDSNKKEVEKGESNRPVGTTQEADKYTWNELDLGGQGLRALAQGLFNFHFLKTLHLNNNNLTSLNPAIGLLRNLTHLNLSKNKLTTLPAEIGMLSQLTDLWLFDNELLTLPSEIGYLYNLKMLGIEGNPDLDHDITKAIMQTEGNGTKALVGKILEEATPTEPPNERDWIEFDDARISGGDADTIKVMTWNSLCDYGATPQQFGYTPRQALKWDYRKEVILAEIRGRDADVVCLQEVDSENYHDWFRPSLAIQGYKGFYFPRSRSRTMNEKEAKRVDGCAMFYKDSKYILLEKHLIEYATAAINRSDMKGGATGNADIFNRVMPRDHIAITGFFENRMTGSRILVGNTHLFWDHVYRDVKVIQVAILMEQLAKLAEGYINWPACKDKKMFRYTASDEDGQESYPEPTPEPSPSQEYSSVSQIPLVLCGDFNSYAGSGVVDLITNGSLARDHPDLGPFKYGLFTRDGITHPFSLKSAYTLKDLPFTNYTPIFKDMIDYIWYSTNTMQVTALLGQVDKEYLKRIPGFPDWHFVSDHLPLLAEFLIKPRKGVVGGGSGSGKVIGQASGK